MQANSRLDELLSQWEELRRQGQTVPAEELCRDVPELLDAFRWHVRALESLARRLWHIGESPKLA